MKFSSLSEAILYYTTARTSPPDYTPFGSFAAENQLVPMNTIYVQPETANVITYGKTIWGTGKIIDVSKPNI